MTRTLASLVVGVALIAVGVFFPEIATGTGISRIGPTGLIVGGILVVLIALASLLMSGMRARRR